jgi:hypothetical protein
MFQTALLRANQIFKKEMLKQCIFKKGNITQSSVRFRFSAYHFPVLFQTATFEMQRYLFSAYMTS